MTELKKKLEELFLKIIENHISRLSDEDKPPIKFSMLKEITKYVKFLEEFKIQEDPDILKKKRELIKKLFDENKEYPMEEILIYCLGKGEIKEIEKKVNPLKGIREVLEEVFTIQQLENIIKGFEDIKKTPEKEVESLLKYSKRNILPFLQKMKNGGGDTSKIDPMMLMMAMGMNEKNANMGQLFLIMSMLNMNAQQHEFKDGESAQTPIITPEMIKAIWTELQNVMQQQQQKSTIDPNMMLLFQMMSKTSVTSKENIETILNTMIQNNQTKELATLMEKSNERFRKGIKEVAEALNCEMNYDIRKKELDIKELARRDMLDREERVVIREDASKEEKEKEEKKEESDTDQEKTED